MRNLAHILTACDVRDPFRQGSGESHREVEEIKPAKLRRVPDDVMEHPRTGIGHPEPLVGGGDITWSRRITAHDRIIYDIHDEEVVVVVVEVEGHYDDK